MSVVNEIEFEDLLRATKGKRQVPIVRDDDAKWMDHVCEWALVSLANEQKSIPKSWRKQLNNGDAGGPIIRTFRSSLVAGEPCKRYMVMQMFYPGKDKPVPAKNAAYFDDGNWRHKRIQGWMSRVSQFGAAKVVIEYEFLHLPLRQSGHIDVLANLHGVKQLAHLGQVVLELKGIKSSYFDDLLAPSWTHYLQAQIYMNRTGARWAFVIYERKDNQDRKVYKLAYDSKIGKEVDGRLMLLNKHVDRLKTRVKSPEPGDLPKQEIAKWCSSCPQKVLCFALAERGR